MAENNQANKKIRESLSVEQSKEELKLQQHNFEDQHTLIVQKYIDKPLLINKRKFDIRVYAMLVCSNGVTRGYFYEEGYIRTSSKEYSISNNKLKNKFVHLTNDAI